MSNNLGSFMRKVALLTWVLLLLIPASVAQAIVPLEAFAKNQEISLMRISPNGEMLAFLRVRDGKPLVLVKEIGGPIISGANLEAVKPSNIRWAGNEYLLLTVSNTSRDVRFRTQHQKNEYSRTFSFHIKSQKLVQLLKRSSKNLSTFSINLGTIIAVDHEEPAAYIPAFNNKFELDVYKTDMKRGRAVVVGNGRTALRKWVMNSANKPVARVFHHQKNKDYQIQVPDGNWWKAIYEDKSELVPFSVIGLNMDETALIVDTTTDKVPFEALYEIDLNTGEWNGPLFQAKGYDLGGSIRDPYTNLVVGTSWLADQDEYYWFDPELAKIYRGLKKSLQGYAVRLTSWSKDRKRFVIAIAKAGKQVEYGIYSVDSKELEIVASARPPLDNVVLGDVTSYSYAARDELTIHAYVTTPPKKSGKNLPLVVFPHGGPESRNSANFDWMAQMLAAQGYAVFQPNFRGSDGYGWEFTAAGHGEWGRAMQHDITDGVQDLIAKGVVDPNRICIAGASYGGYAALAGGAFTPDLYKCVISIAGVSDLQSMYDWTKGEYGSDHWAVAYWDRSMSGDEKRKIAMQAASPIRFADQFKAPVLLIHGKDDTVVHIRQSTRMNTALKKAGVDVRLVIQKNGDHWMSFEKTRLQIAREMVAFLDEHLK